MHSTSLGLNTKYLARWFVAGGIIWTTLLLISLYWNYSNGYKQSVELASIEARAHFNKNKAIRLWASSHGGVYVPINASTPPNPRLSHVPERDITTPSGKKLTLMNSSYMLRQMMNDYDKLYGVKGKVTTFPDKLFYQGNMPDAWELDALRSFQQGNKELKEVININGIPHVRLMRPRFIKEDCLKCHGSQGYKIGDIGGALGVSVSMKPYLDVEQEDMRALSFSYFILWMIGLLGLRYFYTRVKKYTQELSVLSQQFQQAQKMEAIGTLVGGIAHDFNNMLAGMTGNLYLAKINAHGLPDVLDKLTNVEQLSLRAAEMIQQLLTFARKGDATIKPMLLGIFIKETIKLLRVSVPENINLSEDICTESLTINGDSSQIHQILMNLVNNARDAIDDIETPCITIKLEALHADDKFIGNHPDLVSGNYAHLSIEDNGQGIPKHQIEHLFEPFFTTKEVGKGTGLGLSMVFGAIKTHQGFIDVKSIENRGTTFHIYLPLIEQENITYASSPKQEQEAAKGYGETILLVDDEEELLYAGKNVLENLGYQVLEASNGMEAIDIFTTNRRKIALIIIDLVMPKLGGVKAIERIRKIDSDIKVIFTTGYDKNTSLSDNEILATDIILTKPYNVEEFSKTIRNQLD